MLPSAFTTAWRRHNLRRAFSTAYKTSLVVIVLLVSGVLAQKLTSSISEPEGKALIGLSRILAAAPASTSANVLRDVGYNPTNVPPGWANYPMVRKIETVYLAAEQARPKQGSYALALMARSLAQQYNSVNYDPILKAYLDLSVPPEALTFVSLTQYEKPDPTIQRAILAISRYAERGRLGGPAGILQFHFNLPPEAAYDILRSSASNEEAISRGLARISPERRQAYLERLISRLDDSFPDTAPFERDLDPFRPHKRGHTSGPIITDEHTSPPDNSRPSGSGGGGVGGGGSGTSVSTDKPRSIEPGGGSETRVGTEPASTSEFIRHPQETYETRVPEWYGSAPVAFEEMVVVEGGAGGVVFGNAFKSLIQKQPVGMEYLPLSDSGGQLIIHFSDNSEASYGPVDTGDVYAAYHIVFGDGKAMPEFHEGQGVPLLGIENRRTHYDLVDDSIDREGVIFSVVAHPALSHVALGRSVLMCDVLPIGRTRLQELIRQVDETKVPEINKAMPADVGDWKITDASISLTIDQDQILIKNPGRKSSHGTFLTSREYRSGESKFAPDLISAYEAFVPTLIEASPDYKRLNEFVPVFDLFRWVHARHVSVSNMPNLSASAPQTIPDWVATADGGITLLFNEDSVTPLQALRSKVEHRVAELQKGAPDSWQQQLSKIDNAWMDYATAEEQIDLVESHYRERANASYRSELQLIRILESSSETTQYRHDVAESSLNETIRRALSEDADEASLRELYDEQDKDLETIEVGLVPSAKDDIHARHVTMREGNWQLVPLRRAARQRLDAAPTGPQIYELVTRLLPADEQETIKELRTKVDQASGAPTMSDDDKADDAQDALEKIDWKIRKHFSQAAPALKKKFESFDFLDWDTPEFDVFLHRAAPSLWTARKEASARLEEVRKHETEAVEAAESAQKQIDSILEKNFPGLATWAKLLTSYDVVKL
jgi:hypothetical protein